MTKSQPIAEVCYGGKCWSLIPGGTDAQSYFGGPHTVHVESSVDLEAAIIHHIATINLPKFGVGSPQFGFSVPLFYGICHEGCTIEYRKTAIAAVEISSLEPAEADEGYPYHGYPPVIPFYQLGLGDTHGYAPAELENRLAHTGWVLRDDCFYVIVMQHPATGHCLFEPGSEVEIVFEYDPAPRCVICFSGIGRPDPPLWADASDLPFSNLKPYSAFDAPLRPERVGAHRLQTTPRADSHE